MRDPLVRVIRSDTCTGCGACEVIAPETVRLQESSEGFLRPRASAALSPDQASQLERVCPALTVRQERHRDDEVWGPALGAAFVWSTDGEVRFRGSSGGGLTAILLHLLAEDVVDGVVQVRASQADPLVTKWCLSRTREEIIEAAGSRYAPVGSVSGLGAVARDLDGRYAFVGKPCEVFAARQLAARRADLQDRIVLFLSFLCAGVSSQRATERLVHDMGVDRSEISAFRYRGHGWPGAVTAVCGGGTRAELSYDQAWGGVLNRSLQFRCKICADAIGEMADLSFGDGWHEQPNGEPSFAEAPGRSVVIVRTPRGRDVIEQAAAARRIEMTPMEIRALDRMQPYHVHRKRALVARLIGARAGGLVTPSYRGLGLLRNARYLSPVGMIREGVGAYQRARRIRRRQWP